LCCAAAQFTVVTARVVEQEKIKKRRYFDTSAEIPDAVANAVKIDFPPGHACWRLYTPARLA